MSESETPKTRLFFFKANAFDLKAVETYLTKRDYDVQSESDLKQALIKILEFEPAFVFIAWDHPHERIRSVPKFINQSLMTTIVPYIQSSSREQLRHLENSGFSCKLFPPVSGPAVIRTILKIEKEQKQVSPEIQKSAATSDQESQVTMVSGTISKKSENLQSFLDDVDKHAVQLSALPTASTEDKKSQIHIQKGTRGDLIKYNKTKLTSLHTTLTSEGLKSELKTALQQEFENNVKNQIVDLTQTHLETETEIISLNNAGTPFYKKLLCLVVQSDNWCGYLLLASQLRINNSDYQSILQSWLQNQFINMPEISESDCFEVHLDYREVNLKDFAKANADYLEIINVEKNEILISFFSIDPKYLILELSETYEMLEVPLDIIETEKKIPMSLFLHLPDNKKYILYTPSHKMLSTQQKVKLAEKSITKLYTPIDFENELQKYKAESYLNESIRKLKKVSL